jgi:hypothetical protein
MLVTPLSATAVVRPFESSSIFQPAMLTGVVPAFVTSNQSAAYVVVPLPQGATSETKTVGPVGVSSVTSVSVSVNVALASGVPPTVGSSTSTVTE